MCSAVMARELLAGCSGLSIARPSWTDNRRVAALCQMVLVKRGEGVIALALESFVGSDVFHAGEG